MRRCHSATPFSKCHTTTAQPFILIHHHLDIRKKFRKEISGHFPTYSCVTFCFFLMGCGLTSANLANLSTLVSHQKSHILSKKNYDKLHCIETSSQKHITLNKV